MKRQAILKKRTDTHKTKISTCNNGSRKRKGSLKLRLCDLNSSPLKTKLRNIAKSKNLEGEGG